MSSEEGDRKFNAEAHYAPSEGAPIKTIMTKSADAAIVAWIIKPGQAIEPHVHPEGQDTYVVMSGQGLYTLDEAGTTTELRVGDVIVARRGEVHGVFNNGAEDLKIVSVVSPSEAGFSPVAVTASASGASGEKA